MKRYGPKTAIRQARERVRAEISGHAARGGRFAGGLASEGYSGGYLDALDDVSLLLNGVQPKRRNYWEREDVA